MSTTDEPERPIGDIWRETFPSIDWDWHLKVNKTLVEKVLSRGFKEGRYFHRNGWHYAYPGMMNFDPIGILESSIPAIDIPFAYCHLQVGTSTIKPAFMEEINRWCQKQAAFYPVFVWRSDFTVERIESYVLCPTEQDAVLLQAHLCA